MVEKIINPDLSIQGVRKAEGGIRSTAYKSCFDEICGEAGEVAEQVKKHFFHGHELDKRHMIEELGDVAWYLAVLCDAIGSDLDTVMEENLKKLEQRYPEGFDPYRSQHRNELGG